MLRPQQNLTDHTYTTHLVDGGAEYINYGIRQLPFHIDTHVGKLDFHEMSLRSTNIILGCPWFFNKNASLSFYQTTHSMFVFTG